MLVTGDRSCDSPITFPKFHCFSVILWFNSSSTISGDADITAGATWSACFRILYRPLQPGEKMVSLCDKYGTLLPPSVFLYFPPDQLRTIHPTKNYGTIYLLLAYYIWCYSERICDIHPVSAPVLGVDVCFSILVLIRCNLTCWFASCLNLFFQFNNSEVIGLDPEFALWVISILRGVHSNGSFTLFRLLILVAEFLHGTVAGSELRILDMTFDPWPCVRKSLFLPCSISKTDWVERMSNNLVRLNYFWIFQWQTRLM